MRDKIIVILLILLIIIGICILSYFQYNQAQKLDYFCFGGSFPHIIEFNTYSDYLIFKEKYSNRYMHCKQNIAIINEEYRFCNAGHYGCVSHDKIDYMSHGLEWNKFYEQKSIERCARLFC